MKLYELVETNFYKSTNSWKFYEFYERRTLRTRENEFLWINELV